MVDLYYFAYSELIDPAQLHRLKIQSTSHQVAYIKNYRLVFNVLEDECFRFERRGLVNISPLFGSRVEGILYTVQESDFSLLDEYFGVPDMKYYRIEVQGVTQLGETFTAMTYTGWPDVTAQGLLPYEKYLKKLIFAARQNGRTPELQHWFESHPTIP